MTEPATPRLVPYWIDFAPRDWVEIDDDEPAAPPRTFVSSKTSTSPC